MRRTWLGIPLGVLLTVLPAWAAVFPDVPADHWAAGAIADLRGLDSALLEPLPDGLFHGEAPYTRFQFARTLEVLVGEMEAMAGTSFAGRDTGANQFPDVPEDHPRRAAILRLANRYRLFEGVPELDPANFRGDTVVSRYELAVVIDNLMRQAEGSDVIRVSSKPAPLFPFADVPATSWARPVVESVWGRYGVMVGFPDGTFRGQTGLTRYQFAATAGQTLPLIRAMVVQTTAEKAEEKGSFLPFVGAFDEAPWRAAVLLGIFILMRLS